MMSREEIKLVLNTLRIGMCRTEQEAIDSAIDMLESDSLENHDMELEDYDTVFNRGALEGVAKLEELLADTYNSNIKNKGIRYLTIGDMINCIHSASDYFRNDI